MQPVNIKYLLCKKGQYHQGQYLNVICLNPQCIFDPLCCCICVDQYHQGHKTKTLKSFINQLRETAKNNQNTKIKIKGSSNPNQIYDLIDESRKNTIKKFKPISYGLERQVNKIQEILFEFYMKLQSKIQNQQTLNPCNNLIESIKNIQSAKNISSLIPSVQRLIKTMKSVENVQKNKQFKEPLSQDSLINLLQYAVQGTVNQALQNITTLGSAISQNNKKISLLTQNIDKLFFNEKYQFTQSLKAKQIILKNQFRIFSKAQNSYKIALMSPTLSSSKSTSTFSFKILKNTNNWIAIGVAHKNIVQQNNYQFNCYQTGHGCYMISSNSGSWSNIDFNFNNVVKAFSFIQGDVITCIVNKQTKQITFMKNIINEENQDSNYSSSISTSHSNYFRLKISENTMDLHPCVVFYFPNDQVQFVPSNSLPISIPKYSYNFSPQLKHYDLTISNNQLIKSGYYAEGYRTGIIKQPLEDEQNKTKKISFRVTQSAFPEDWFAIGMCHVNTARQSNYCFEFDKAFHGHYMISGNGGTWSTINPKKNNVIKAFNFGKNDIVQCQIQFGTEQKDPNNKIVFKKGIQSYCLNFQKIQGNPLHPCVVIFHNHISIQILPNFQQQN